MHACLSKYSLNVGFPGTPKFKSPKRLNSLVGVCVFYFHDSSLNRLIIDSC